MQTTQALLGEQLLVFEDREGWLWVQLSQDGYVGYVRRDHAQSGASAPTHRISVPLTFSFPEASIKSRPVISLSLNALVTATEFNDKFLQLADGRFLYRAHAHRVDVALEDFVSLAAQFKGVPYLWGGKSFGGLDCSGLVQVSLQACGIACPRDSDMQEAELGTALPVDDLSALRRGDLVFWKGHVGIMQDAQTLLHANGHHLQVVSEPLQEAIARIAATGSQVTAIRRL